MRIAYIVPSLDSKAPVFLAKRLSDFFYDQGNDVTVFYFDDIVKVSFKCRVQRIKFNEPFFFDDYDIIHSHMLRPDKYIAKFSYLIKNAKTVSTIHCNIKDDLFWTYGSFVSFVYEKLWLGYLRKFDATVQINDYLMDLYSKYLKNNHLIYNGISISPKKDDYSDIISKIREFKSSGKKVLCSYSGIVKRKGLLQILKLLKNRADFAYICIGEGAQKTYLMNFAEKHGISERIYFSPFKENPYYVMEYADIFVIPSYSEGFSLAMLEAGTVGSSIVCSDIPSFNIPFSTENVTFFIINNMESLEKAVDEAYELRNEKRKALKKKIVDCFSEEKMFLSYQKLYEELKWNIK